MSAATETTATAPIVHPEVAESTGQVEASDAFKNANETGHTTTIEPALAAETNPTTTETTDASNVSAPTAEEKVGKKETQITATPVTSGVLGYKAPGLMSQLRFKPHYFELGDAAVPTSDLTQYLRGEKPDVAHSTVAWSSQTGKGLLYISKNEDSKKSPDGILNLADVTNVAKEGEKIFSFRLGRHKHSFEAKTQDERNGWLAAIESTHEAAAKAKDEIQSSQGYKDTVSSLNAGKTYTPATAATAGTAGAAAAAGGAGAAAATHVHDDKKEETADEKAEDRRKSESDDEKNKAKSRSRSNKRSSVFGTILGKRDEKKEQKNEAKENQKEAKVEKKEETSAAALAKKDERKAEKLEERVEKDAAKEAKLEQKEAQREEKAVEKEIKKEEKAADKEVKREEKAVEKEIKNEEKAAEKLAKQADKKHQHEEEAAATAGASAGAAVVAEQKKSSKTDEAPKDSTERSKSKRRSIFGIFDKKSPNTEKKESEVVPAAGTSSGAGVKAENKAVDAFKDDPTPTEHSSPAKDILTIGATSTEAKTDGVKGGEASSPSTSKRSSILGSVFRRPSKQAKSTAEEAKKEKKETPATVPETSEADKTVTSASTQPVAVPAETSTVAPTETSKASEPAIGDVVPDAVTVGEADAPKPVGTTA